MLTRRVTVRAPTRSTGAASARPAVSGVKRRREDQHLQQHSSTDGSAAAVASSHADASNFITRSNSIKSARGNCKRQKAEQSASSPSPAAAASASSAPVAAAAAASASTSRPPAPRRSTAAATAAAMAKRAKRKAALAKAQAKREENKKHMQTPDLPAHWSPSVDAAPGNDSLVLLRADDPTVAVERAAVFGRFISTINLPQTPQVQSVYRVQQPAVYRAYQRRKAELVAAGGVADIEVFHGPRSTPLHLIHSTSSIGFDPRRGVSLPGHVWFARNANISHHYSQLANLTSLSHSCLPLCHVSSAHLPLSGVGYMGSHFMPNPPAGSLHALYAARIAIPRGWSNAPGWAATRVRLPSIHNRLKPPIVYTVMSAAESMPTHLIIYKTCT